VKRRYRYADEMQRECREGTDMQMRCRGSEE